MEFFHEPKIDWMGLKWYFISLSLVLIVAGIVSIIVHRGLTYGIEFRSGTQVTVKFAQAPKVQAIRSRLSGASIQSIGSASDHELMIEMPLAKNASSGAEALDTGKADIVKALTAVYGGSETGKVDLNNASAKVIANHLLVADPLALAGKGMDAATKGYSDLAAAIVTFRNSASQGGLVGSFDELKSVTGVTPAVISSLQKDFFLSSFTLGQTTIVGPKVGSDLRRQALYVTLAGLGAMLIYIWFRFELIYGIAAVIATFHDVIITIGFFSLLGKEISLTVIAALLTLVGYSMNDTIVVFDRIRENVRTNRREKFLDLVNRSINQTLSRTVLTSGLTFLAVLSLFLFGGEVIHGFALTLVIGVIIGTYSSIAIASPVLVFWQTRTGKGLAVKQQSKTYSREVAASRR